MQERSSDRVKCHMSGPNYTAANPPHEGQRRELVAHIARLRVAACSDGDREVREALEAALAALERIRAGRESKVVTLQRA